MFYRVVVVSVLLGISAFIQIKGATAPFQTSLYCIYFVIAVTYLLSILYVLLQRVVRDVLMNVFVQSMMDVMLITSLVYVTGGIESIYVTLYPLVIIYTVLFTGKKGALFIATVSSALYGILMQLEYVGLVDPFYSGVHSYDFSGGYVFSRMFTYVLSFYIIAFLASFVVEQEKSARTLLSQKESAFNQLDLLHRSIIESVGVGIVTLDPEGRVKSCNRAAEEICGYHIQQVRNRNIDTIFPELTKEMEQLTLNRTHFDITYLSKDGHEKILRFSVHPLYDHTRSKIGNILIFEDRTAIKGMEQEVEKNKRLAIIGEMTAVLAHELRTPLASICGSIQLLKSDLDIQGTDDEKLMEIIVRGKEQLEGLIRDFLLLARPNQEAHEAVDVGELIENIMESVRFNPGWNENIEIEKGLSDRNRLRGNGNEIRQAIWNIVMNAFQAMPEGGTLRVVTKVMAPPGEKEMLEIVIADTGCGIPPEHLNNILDPFYTTKDLGTGLGLAIVNRVVENHGGKFIIESEVDRGTCCRMLLPCSDEGR